MTDFDYRAEAEKVLWAFRFPGETAAQDSLMRKNIAREVELYGRRAAAAAYRDSSEALLESKNALLDYIQTLERQGGMMGYGRSVLRKIESALAKAKELEGR